MARCEVIISDEEKRLFKEYCKANNISEASALRLFIREKTKYKNNKIEERSNQINIRLSQANLEDLDSLWKAEGFASRTHWVTSKVLSGIYKQPILTDAEYKALNDSNYVLKDSLNALKRAKSNAVKHSMLDTTLKHLEHHIKTISDLLEKNSCRWNHGNTTFNEMHPDFAKKINEWINNPLRDIFK